MHVEVFLFLKIVLFCRFYFVNVNVHMILYNVSKKNEWFSISFCSKVSFFLVQVATSLKNGTILYYRFFVSIM